MSQDDPPFSSATPCGALRLAADVVRSCGRGRPSARLRITTDASGVNLEVIAPPAPPGEPGPLDA